MFQALTPIVRLLLYANLIAYGIERLTGDGLFAAFALWPVGGDQLYGTPPFEPWQLLTYAFLHDRSNLMHLIGNMFAL